VPIEYDSRRAALYAPERQQTLFQRGQTYSPLQLAVEGARLAYYRAEKSEAEKARLAEALARVDFTTLVLFTDAKTGTEAFAARRDDGTTLLAFRGTQPDDVTDLATDLRAHTVAWPESAGRVHAGFAVAARSLIPQIQEWVAAENVDVRKMIVTGHSLGAALATLAGTVLRPGVLVALGSPRVGDADFAASLAATNLVRLVDCCDAVTEVPPPLGGYKHVHARTYITRTGEVVENPPQSLVDSDRQRARMEYITQYAWKTGSVLVRDLADHAPINYARAVFP
jgi:predicted lipase